MSKAAFFGHIYPNFFDDLFLEPPKFFTPPPPKFFSVPEFFYPFRPKNPFLALKKPLFLT